MKNQMTTDTQSRSAGTVRVDREGFAMVTALLVVLVLSVLANGFIAFRRFDNSPSALPNRVVAAKANPRAKCQRPVVSRKLLDGGGCLIKSPHWPNRAMVSSRVGAYHSSDGSLTIASAGTFVRSSRATCTASALRPSIIKEAFRKWRLCA